MSEDRSKKQLEDAVNKIGRAMGRLAEVVEVHGHAISKEQLDKVFTYLGHLQATSAQKCVIARQHAVAVNGGFSLDAELPVEPLIAAITAPAIAALVPPTPRPAPSIVPAEEEIDLVDDDELEAAITAVENAEAVKNPDAAPAPAPAGPKRFEGRLTKTDENGNARKVEPVFTFDEPAKPKPRREDPSEKPDKTGAIKDAGFLEED